LDGPAADTDPNVAYTWGYGLSGDAATHARLEKITLPGGRQVYYNYEDVNAFASWHGHPGHESRGRPGPALRRESAATGGTPVVLMGGTPMLRFDARANIAANGSPAESLARHHPVDVDLVPPLPAVDQKNCLLVSRSVVESSERLTVLPMHRDRDRPKAIREIPVQERASPSGFG